tara:strand:+ start:21948 stop:22862 length:915 start_codon:yes stop_codon:yes gene_type:complete
MIKLNVHNETSELSVVILGIANDFGGTPNLEDCYDPKSKEHVISGTFPLQSDITKEINEFLEILEKYNVDVLRPKNIPNLNQVFSRDISFVIADKLIVPNIIEDRKQEIEAISHIFKTIPEEDVIIMPKGTRAEGGDVMLWNNYIFIGYSEKDDFDAYKVARTNIEAVNFIKDKFPNKQVKAFELNKSDINPKQNALHLDCCFQTIGLDKAIMYKEGFKNQNDIDFLINLFGEENMLFITKEEMYHMNSNVFSISQNVIVSEKGFTRLNNELRKKGFIVEEIQYSEIAKMEGLLRCSTMPLIRK